LEALKSILSSKFKIPVDKVCKTSMNGQLAVDNVKQEVRQRGYNPYALILMDCNMPVLDGYAATKQIRQFIETENLK
jgi:CheY-like chemotaxis protein